MAQERFLRVRQHRVPVAPGYFIDDVSAKGHVVSVIELNDQDEDLTCLHLEDENKNDLGPAYFKQMPVADHFCDYIVKQ